MFPFSLVKTRYRKNLIINLLVLLGSIIFCLVMAEILLRVFKPVEFRLRGNTINMSVMKNRRIIIENDRWDKLDKVITRSSNSLGFRGENPPYLFESYLTIVAMGGSTTECYYLSDGHDWPAVLGKKLKKSFNRVWVNNAGLDGHTTFGHLCLVNDYLAFVKPKVVLFFVGLNDMYAKGSSNRYDKVFTEIVERAKSSGQPKRKSFSVLTFCKRVYNGSGLSYLAEYSDLVNLLQTIGRALKAVKGGVGHAQVNVEKMSHCEIDEDTRNSVLNEHREYYIKQYEERLTRLVKLTKSLGMESVLITQNALWGNCIDDVTGVNLGTICAGNINTGVLWDMLEIYNSATRRIGMKEDVPVVDLAGEMPHCSAYFYDWYHFTNEGAEKAAEIISNSLSIYLRKMFPQYEK